MVFTGDILDGRQGNICLPAPRVHVLASHNAPFADEVLLNLLTTLTNIDEPTSTLYTRNVHIRLAKLIWGLIINLGVHRFLLDVGLNSGRFSRWKTKIGNLPWWSCWSLFFKMSSLDCTLAVCDRSKYQEKTQEKWNDRFWHMILHCNPRSIEWPKHPNSFASTRTALSPQESVTKRCCNMFWGKEPIEKCCSYDVSDLSQLW